MKKAATISELIVDIMAMIGMFAAYLPGSNGVLFKALDYVYNRVGMNFTRMQLWWITTAVFAGTAIVLAINIGLRIGRLTTMTTKEL